jgi:type VI secretion system protein ImpH
MPDLIQELISEPYQFSLLQAINIIERYCQTLDSNDLTNKNRLNVEYKAHVSMAFPSSDVQSILIDETTQEFKLYTPLICLSGSTGPIPKIFTELFLESRKNKDNAPLDFLDIFNHRLIELFFSQKKKYHLAIGNNKLAEIPILKFLDSVSSSETYQENSTSPPYSAWLRHASLQGPAPRSVEGLIKILSERLSINFKAYQFYGIWLDLDSSEQASLSNKSEKNKKSLLGLNTTLGKRFWDQNAGILLKAINLTNEMFYSLLPWHDKNRKLNWLIERHFSSPRKLCLELHLDIKKFKPLALGHRHGPLLGLSSWIVGPQNTSSSGAEIKLKLEPCRFWLKNTQLLNQLEEPLIFD